MSRVVHGSASGQLLHSGTKAEALGGAGSCCAKEHIRSHLRAPHEPFTWTAYFVGYVAYLAAVRVSLLSVELQTHKRVRRRGWLAVGESNRGCRKAEACAWILASLALGYFGNGEHDTLYVLMHDVRIHKPALMAAVMAGAGNVLIFLYVNIWVRHVRGISQDPELAVPWAIPLATAVCVFGWISALTACWGVWSWGTPALGAVHGMALIMWSTFLPDFGFKDHQE